MLSLAASLAELDRPKLSFKESDSSRLSLRVAVFTNLAAYTESHSRGAYVVSRADIPYTSSAAY